MPRTKATEAAVTPDGFTQYVMNVRVMFTEPLLGSQPGDPEIYSTYIGSKSPDASASLEEEIAALGKDAIEDRTKTVFPRTEDGEPFIYDYQWKGFMKDNCGALRAVPGTKSSGLKAYKKAIDGRIYVAPRRVMFDGIKGGISDCQRALRASTPQGERVALANSEEIPAGTTMRFKVIAFVQSDLDLAREWLNFGRFRGLGQWRNSGRGRFLWDELDDDGAVIGGNMEAFG